MSPVSEEEPEPPARVFRSIKERYDENRDLDMHGSWREWLRDRYAKYWYGLGCIALDSMVAGTIINVADPTQAWSYAAAVAAVLGLAYLEFRGYLRFWPPKKRT